MNCWFRQTCIAVVLSVAAGPGANAENADYWPGKNWDTVSPESAGFDPAALDKAQRFTTENLPHIRSLLVVRNGRMVLEKYFGGADARTQTDVASVTKSIVSLLFGIAAEEGRLGGPAATLGTVFPDYLNDVPDPLTRNIDMHQMLSMTPGFRWSDRGEDYWTWRFSKNRPKTTLHLTRESPPGEVFNYNTGVAHVLGFAIERATGSSLLDYANRKLFEPLGWTQTAWERDPKGVYTGGNGLSLSARQMAKLGHLLLRHGKWEGRQIVPSHWIRRATGNQLKRIREIGYGYLFWIRDFGGCRGYMAWGRGGQFIVVVPEKNLVVAVTSYMRSNRSSAYYLPLFELIAEAADGKCAVEGTIAHFIAGQPENARDPIPKLPAAVRDHFKSVETAILKRDLQGVMAHYSRDFFDSGEDFEARESLWRKLLPQVTDWQFELTGYDISDRGIAYEGRVVSNVRNMLFPGYLVLEGGRWLEQGSPEGRQSTAGIPPSLVEFLRSFGRMLGRGDAAELAPYFSERYLSNGFSKPEFSAFFSPFVPKLGETSFQVSNFRRDGDVVILNGTISFANIGGIPLRLGFGHAVREDGRWLWYGNQVPE